ncbi:unnamed protein product, partial [Lymnaea stagnalis]
MASKTQHVQKFINFINQQFEILKAQRESILENVDESIKKVHSEVDAWVSAGLVNQTTCVRLNNRIQQVIALFMAKSIELSDLEINENESDHNQTSSAHGNDSTFPKTSYTRGKVQERTILSNEETGQTSSNDTPYITPTKFAILEEAVFSLKRTTEQIQEKQENFDKKLEVLTNENSKSDENIQGRLTVLEKKSQCITSNGDILFKNITNVDDKLNRLEDKNKSVNISMNELNKQISSARTCSNDALMSIQDLSKS